MRLDFRFRTLFGALAAAGLLACGSTAPSDPELEDPAQLRLAPTTSAQLAGFTYRLETYLWRDFQPGADQTIDGSALLAAVKVTVNDDTAAFPVGVAVDRLWVVNGDVLWRTVPREEQPRGADGHPERLAVMGRGGPRWGPGVAVDVIVRLRDRAGNVVLLRAPSQPIHRTD